MNRPMPNRLMNEQFLMGRSPFSIFLNRLYSPTDLHWHEFYEMHLILSGSGEHLLNGKRYRLSKGSMFLLSPADFHQVIPDSNEELELLNVIFSRQMIDDNMYDFLFQLQGDYVHDCTDEQFNTIERDFRRLFAEFHQTSSSSHYLIRALLECILIEFYRIRNSNITESSRIAPEEIKKSLLYIQHHFRDSLSLTNVAQEVGLSPNYFSERFSKYTGITFQSYLQEIRLKFAKSLAGASELSVTEICYVSGFNTLTHFERVFKRKFGVSVREYRRAQQEVCQQGTRGGKPCWSAE